jgi:hypothetical protein
VALGHRAAKKLFNHLSIYVGSYLTILIGYLKIVGRHVILFLFLPNEATPEEGVRIKRLQREDLSWAHSHHIQGTFREHSGHSQGTVRAVSGNTQGTFIAQSGNIQKIFKDLFIGSGTNKHARPPYDAHKHVTPAHKSMFDPYCPPYHPPYRVKIFHGLVILPDILQSLGPGSNQ